MHETAVACRVIYDWQRADEAYDNTFVQDTYLARRAAPSGRPIGWRPCSTSSSGSGTAEGSKNPDENRPDFSCNGSRVRPPLPFYRRPLRAIMSQSVVLKSRPRAAVRGSGASGNATGNGEWPGC